MTDLVVTNAFSKGQAKTKLKIKGNVDISNYKQNDTKPTAHVWASVKDGSAIIKTPKGNTESLDLSNEKYNALVKIAGASEEDGKTELSWYDLRDMDTSKIGLNDSFIIKKDLQAGIANIYKKVGNKLTTWLHIDFETQKEQQTTAEKKTENKREQQQIQKEEPIYAELVYNDLGPMASKENGLGTKGAMKIPANTSIETNKGTVVIDEKGQAWIYKNGNWARTNSLEFMGTLSSKVLGSIADNDKYDQTLSKEDLKFTGDKNKDLTSNLYGDSYKVKNCGIYIPEKFEKQSSIITVQMGSDVFSKVEDDQLKIVFDRDIKKYMADTQFEEAARKAPKAIYEQIAGPSLNENTLEHLNHLSDRELLAVIRQYNKHAIVVDSTSEKTYGDAYGTVIDEVVYYSYNQKGLFEDLNNEWGLGIKEIMPIMDRALSIIPEYLKDNENYQELVNIMGTIDRESDEDFEQELIVKIDNLFAKVF